MKLTSENRNLLLLVVIGIILRLIFIPFVQITDADATSRIFISEKWLDNPTFLTEGIWPPFHYYFNAIALMITGERIYGPMLFHIVITCLTIIPLYHFTKREFAAKGAWFSIVFYLLCPIIFRNSFQALSGLPHAFFIAMALNSISKSIRFKDVNQAIYAGIFLTIAAGFRYEAWLLIAVFTVIFLLFKQFKLVLFFWCFSMIFPIFWMTGNYIAHNELLFGLAEPNNLEIAFGFIIERVIFFPFSWFFLFSPLFVILIGSKIYQKIKAKELKTSRLIWSIPFWTLLTVFIYKTYEETLLMQHRFTILLILFSTPFISILFENVQWNRLKVIGYGLVFASLMPLSYVWMRIPYENIFAFSDTLNYVFTHIREGSQNQFEAIPTISDQNYVEYSIEINNKLKKKSGLVLDFTTWDNGFYLALNSTIKAKQIFLINGTKNGQIDLESLKSNFSNYPKGVILLNSDSMLVKNYQIKDDILTIDDSCVLKLTAVLEKSKTKIFEYQLLD